MIDISVTKQHSPRKLRSETAHTPKRLLILDDERVITDTLCIILKQHGYRTRGAYTHGQALAVAQVFQPDVFLTGFYNACDENGCETAAALLAFLPRCRVIVLSGSASAADTLKEYGERGYAFEVLAKPVHPQDLLERLRLAT